MKDAYGNELKIGDFVKAIDPKWDHVIMRILDVSEKYEMIFVKDDEHDIWPVSRKELKNLNWSDEQKMLWFLENS